MKVIDGLEARSSVLRSLGFPLEDTEWDSTEALAALLRRAASFYCPCPSGGLREVACRTLAQLSDDASLRERVDDVLETLIALGDLLELRDPESSRLLVYACPPSFVWRESYAVLLGLAADDATPLPEDMERQVAVQGCLRRLEAGPQPSELHETLLGLKFNELSVQSWTAAPPLQSAKQHLARLTSQLRPASGQMAELRIVSPKRAVTYYSGRWDSAKTHTGLFIGRRPQEYGADVWCFVSLCDGQLTHMVDLPLVTSEYRGCDDAWRLLCALDAERGNPQQYRLRQVESGDAAVELFSPIPGWAQRLLELVGRKIPAARCLMSYQMTAADARAAVKYLHEYLWIEAEEHYEWL